MKVSSFIMKNLICTLVVVSLAAARSAGAETVVLPASQDVHFGWAYQAPGPYNDPEVIAVVKAAIPQYGFEGAIQFDLSRVSGTIVSAKLEIYEVRALNTLNGPWYNYDIGAYPMTAGAWTESPPWPGYAYNATSRYETRTTMLATAGWRSWNVTAAVTDWTSGALANRGFVLHAIDQGQWGDLYALLASRTYHDESLRPRLVLEVVANDLCPSDPAKSLPGVCGCGVPDTDTDGGGTPDCRDACVQDPHKAEPRVCGCGVEDVDANNNGTMDCVERPDADHDGVDDTADNCPSVANSDQADADGDGAGDRCDACPADVNGDSDGDGLCDSQDPCPTDAANDTDGDGICDSQDHCLNDPTNADRDGDGRCDAVDPCPLDPSDDADHDGLCADQDTCPLDPTPDPDHDGLCSDDACPNDFLNDADGDGLCQSVDACPFDPDNDVDGDGACALADNCDFNANPDQADADGDGFGDACDDDVPPSLEVQPVPTVLDADHVTITGVATDAGGSGVNRVSVTLVGGTKPKAQKCPRQMGLPSADGAFSVDVSGLVEGPNAILVEAFDQFCNVSTYLVEVHVDRTAPDVVVTSPIAGQVFGMTSIELSAEISDDTAMMVSIDGGETQELPPGSHLYTGTAMVFGDGAQEVTIDVVDEAGHHTTHTIPVFVDFRAPVVTLDYGDLVHLGPQPGDLLLLTTRVDAVSATHVALESSASGSESFEVDRGGGTLQSALHLARGTNVITVVVTNELGVQTIERRTVVYDVTAPTGSITSPSSGAFVRGPVELAAEFADELGAVVAVDLSIGGTTYTATHGVGNTWSARLDTTALADGAYTLDGTAFDDVGNAGQVQTTFVIDNTRPTLSSQTADGATVSGTAHFAWSATDAGGVASISIAVNGTAITGCAQTPCEATFDTRSLADGPVAVTATAVDAAGNETTGQIHVIVDNSAPAKFLVSPSTGALVAGSLTISVNVTASDFASAECFFDGTSLGVTSQRAFTRTVNTLETIDGASMVRCTATDQVGNTGTETAVVNIQNWEERFNPETLNLKAKEAKKVTFRVKGKNVELLLPLASANLAIAVPGGTRVPALLGRPCWDNGGRDSDDDDCSGKDINKVLIKFDRERFINSVKAAIASGQLDATRPVTVRLYANGRELGSDTIKVKQ